jgi:parallel beta-helix repeat protein
MPLPGDLTTITVTGSYPAPVGGSPPLTGTVTFQPSADLTDATGKVILRAAPIELLLSAGALSVVLPCTDNATLQPAGWYWIVTEDIDGLPARVYNIELPHTLGASVDLSALVPVVVQPTVNSLYSLIATGYSVYNALNYGATGGGVADDLPGIQAMLNAAQAAGGTAYIPAGTYLVSGIPTITGSNVIIKGAGPGTVIKLATAALNAAGTTIGLWVDGGSNIFVEDLTIDGNFTAIAKDGGQVVSSTQLGASALAAAVNTAPAQGTTEQWSVNNTAATNSAAYAGVPFVVKVDNEFVLVNAGQGTTTWTVRRGFAGTTTATHNNGAALGATNGTVFDSTIATYGINSPKSYMSSQYAGGIDATTYLKQRMPLRITNADTVFVRNVTAQNSISAGILADSTSVNGCTDISVTGCRVRSTWDNAIYAHQGVGHMTVSENITSDTMYNGVSAVFSQFVTVTNNDLRNAGPSFSDSGGVQLNGSAHCAAADNLITGCQYYGIELLATQETNIVGGQGGNQVWASDSTVVGNSITFCNASDFPTHSASGINLFGSAGANIVDNSVNGCDYGISLGSKATQTAITNNRVIGCKSLGINLGNSPDVVGTVVKSNYVSYNGSHGMYVNAPVHAEGNTFIGNNGMGINLSSPPAGVPFKIDLILNNTFKDNTDSGVYANAGAGNLAVVRGNMFGNSDAVIFTDGQITYNSTTLISNTAAFTAADALLPVVIMNQGAFGVTTATTFAAYVSPTQMTLSAPAQATQTGVSFWIGRGPAVYLDASTTNAANSVITSATAGFKSTDAGALAVLLSQSPTPQVLFAGSIQSVTNGTTATLSGPAGAIGQCTLIINRSQGQQIRAINQGSGVLIDRDNLVLGIPELLDGGTTFPLQQTDRQPVYDANITLDMTARTVLYLALTAPRTATLPDARTFPPGVPLLIKDESGACSGITPILLATQAGQTVDGAPSAAISTPYGDATLYANSTGWLTRVPIPIIGYTADAPQDRGWHEWNFAVSEDAGANGTQTFVNQTVYGATFIARTNKTSTKVGYNASALAVTPVSGQNLIAVYSISGTTWTQIAITGDLGTWTATNNAQFANLSQSITWEPGATYAVLAISNAATPVVLRGINGASMSWLNAGLGNTAPPWMKFFTYATGQTGLPTSFTAGAGTMSATGALAPWFTFK